MNHRIPSLPGRACWLLLGLALGCARGAESSPKSGGEPAAPAGSLAASPEPEAQPSTLAEAEQLLARAQAELDQQLALNQPQAPAAGAPAPAPATAAPPADRAQRAEKSAADEAEAPPAPPPPTPCETACRAFASLGRASDAVCRLDSQGGQRCERARQIKEDASRRVAGCGCK